MTILDDPQYIGKRLLERGFEKWFLYFFRIIEGQKFIIEPIHKELFQVFENIHAGKSRRQIINIPPRSGKTSLAKYFVAFCLADDPKSNFIYTSFSQPLLTTIARDIYNIINNHVYRAMYNLSVSEEDKEEEPIDEFWRDYAKHENKKSTFTVRKIETPVGGVCLFASVGSSITGYGAGRRSSLGFSGALIIDDPNKPSDMYSELMRSKVMVYYEETLLSRLNNSSVPICVIQQRLHLQDISGKLLEKYNFEVLSKPLLDENGICQIPTQYDEERLREIRINEYMFQAQYQQKPITDGGSLFKEKWFDFIDEIPSLDKFEYVYATMDTAYKDKESNDFTAISMFGKLDDKLYLIDVYRKKIESIDLPQAVEEFIKPYSKYFDKLWIEPKSSGITLIQGFQRFSSFVKIAKEEDLKEYFPKRDKDSKARARISTNFINDINKNMLIFTGIGCYNEIKSELLSFPNVRHDDFVDTYVDGILLFGKYYTRNGLGSPEALNLYKQMMGF